MLWIWQRLAEEIRHRVGLTLIRLFLPLLLSGTMRCQKRTRCVLLGLCFVSISLFIWVLIKERPARYLLHYLPCPDLLTLPDNISQIWINVALQMLSDYNSHHPQSQSSVARHDGSCSPKSSGGLSLPRSSLSPQIHQTSSVAKASTSANNSFPFPFVNSALKLQYREGPSQQLFPPRFYPQPQGMQQTRTDVLTVTPWLAPIVWEGTFNADLLDSVYKPLNLTIGVTAFAVGKYTRFVSRFLESAEEHFMVGYRVNYYLFTDSPQDIPAVHLQPSRTLSLIPLKRYAHWQEISMRRMELINRHIAEAAHREVDYIFCLDIDMEFRSAWGAESLGEMVAAIHPGYYKVPRKSFPYERRNASAAYISAREGDFYYGGAVFGGLVKNVYEFTRSCHMAILADKANGLMAVWQEESHLNKHFLARKPSKLLSPEYTWDDTKAKPPELRLVRFSSVLKNYKEVRN